MNYSFPMKIGKPCGCRYEQVNTSLINTVRYDRYSICATHAYLYTEIYLQLKRVKKNTIQKTAFYYFDYNELHLLENKQEWKVSPIEWLRTAKNLSTGTTP